METKGGLIWVHHLVMFASRDGKFIARWSSSQDALGYLGLASGEHKPRAGIWRRTQPKLDQLHGMGLRVAGTRGERRACRAWVFFVRSIQSAWELQEKWDISGLDAGICRDISLKPTHDSPMATRAWVSRNSTTQRLAFPFLSFPRFSVVYLVLKFCVVVAFRYPRVTWMGRNPRSRIYQDVWDSCQHCTVHFVILIWFSGLAGPCKSRQFRLVSTQTGPPPHMRQAHKIILWEARSSHLFASAIKSSELANSKGCLWLWLALWPNLSTCYCLL